MDAQTFATFTPKAFYATQSTAFAVTVLLLALRLATTCPLLSLDNILTTLATVLFLASNILWHTQLCAVYVAQVWVAAAAGHDVDMTMGAEEMQDVMNLLRATVVFSVLFHLCLWCVKGAFLVFFWKLRGRVETGRKWFWGVCGATGVGLGVVLGCYNWECTRGDVDFLMMNCTTEESSALQLRLLAVNTAVDAVTECLILSIPIRLLWKVQMSWTKKASLLGLFSLTIFTMITAIIRLRVGGGRQYKTDMTWLYTWSNIQMAVCIIVACLGSFRQLYVAQKTKPVYHSGNSAIPTKRFVMETRGDISLENLEQDFGSSTTSDEESLKNRRNSLERALPEMLTELPHMGVLTYQIESTYPSNYSVKH